MATKNSKWPAVVFAVIGMLIVGVAAYFFKEPMILWGWLLVLLFAQQLY